MPISKRSKIYGLLAMLVICACSSGESPTNVNVGANQQGQNENLPTPVSSSSFGTSNPEFPNEASSSATIENMKKSKFEPVEVQMFYGNEKDDLRLSQLFKYSNFIFSSDSVYSYESEFIVYDENGREASHSIINNSINGSKTSSNGVSHYYKYEDGVQMNYQNVFSETESIVDNEIGWVVYNYSKYKTTTVENQTESESVQTTTKELISSSNEGKEYILRTTIQNEKVNSSYTKIFLDSNGFKYKIMTYNADSSFSSGNIYLKMPNAPEDLSKGIMCSKPIFDENSTYEYYDVSCKDIVSTSETYQLAFESSYKIKNYDKTFYQKYIYTYNRFEY